MRRVAVSGMGAVSAVGIGCDALWRAARDGQSGIGPIDLPHAQGNRVRIGGAVDAFDPAGLIDEVTLRTCERYAQFALVAAQEAVAHAGLDRAAFANGRSAAIIGTGVGGIGTIEAGCRSYYAGQKYDTFAVPRSMPSSAASHVSIAFDVLGPTFAVSSACASGAQAIGLAMGMIRAGMIDRAIVGGAESCLSPGTMRSWEYLRVLTNDKCRPFSTGRSGMAIGEGAGILVIEAEDVLAARGGTPLAWLAGYGTSSDARDMLQPDVDGAARAIAQGLADAGLGPEAIGYVNAHGTGTVLNDLNEAKALHVVFGDRIADVAVSSSKPVIGHTLGAAGALELLITIAALREQVIPPQINCIAPDPRCALRIPVDGAEPRAFDAALSNSLAFGGINAVLVVTRPI